MAGTLITYNLWTRLLLSDCVKALKAHGIAWIPRNVHKSDCNAYQGSYAYQIY